ncbi:MAG: polysaccharide deacetylase family protein [Caldilineaceae bacterium]|nr:polysaccharide deacetylase family protein [Caldilineaceae bacterium]
MQSFLPFSSFVRSSLAVLTMALFLLSPGPARHILADSNGLSVNGADPTRLAGVVDILGVADHPAFRKWQLDLLAPGVEPAFLALGEERLTTPTHLTSLDTRLYPDGTYRLRLRVVHSNLNYDEYFLPIQIANSDQTVSLPAAASAAPVSAAPASKGPLPSTAAAVSAENGLAGNGLAGNALTGNGLATVWRDGILSVRGVAVHPAFRKWQLDLLINGDPNQASFLAVGEEPVPVEQELTTLDPANFPPGQHQLRLRVVYTHLNYDEYLLPLQLGNGLTPVSSGGQGRLLIRGSDQNKAIYLTFDDGPHPRNTPGILEVLATYNAKATFFMVGSQAQGRGPLLKEIYDAGHGIANHTWAHRKLGKADWDTFESEVEATTQVLGAYASRCLRPPYGDMGSALSANAAEAGYTLVFWNVDSLDWKNQNPDSIVREVMTHVKPGSIVLMHDGGGNRAGTIEALKTILAELSADGYTFPALCR